MDKSRYNERFSFADPTGEMSASRSTRYRSRKKRKSSPEGQVDNDSNTEEPHHSEPESGEEQPQQQDSYNSPEFDDDPGEDYPEIEAAAPHDFFNLPEPDEPEEPEESDEFEESSEHPRSSEQSEMPTDSDSSSLLLYEGSQLTVSASSILIMQYKTKHNLTNEAVGDLLQLLKLHCPTPNKCYRSLYLFKKQFLKMKLPSVFHYFCTSCSWTLRPNTSCCPNQSCARDLTQSGAISSFIELSIETQLQKILQRKWLASYI